MKNIIAILVLIFAVSTAKAQTTGTQTITLNLVNTIKIYFSNTGTVTGSSISLPFNSVNDYANGVTSAAQTLVVTSNKNFNITVKANAASFTYSGTTSPAPSMPVNGNLYLELSSNSTGGSIVSPFSATGFSTLTSANQSLITNGSRGSAETFSVKYMADPGFSFPAGTYTVDVVYTATQQ